MEMTLRHRLSLSGIFSATEIDDITDSNSLSVGDGTLTTRHRLLMGPITLLEEVQHNIIRRLELYFSMVRLRAC